MRMKRIKFHDREPGTKAIRDILDAEQSLITFIHSLTNCGKAALISNLIDQLPAGCTPVYINLHGQFITG